MEGHKIHAELCTQVTQDLTKSDQIGCATELVDFMAFNLEFIHSILGTPEA